MLKSRKGTKIYKNFIISYIITLMLPLLIMSVIVLYHFINEMKQEVEINIRNPLIKSIDNFDLYIEQLTKTSLQIELNDSLRNINIQEAPYRAIDLKNELLKYNTNSFIDEIFFYNYADNYVSSFNYLCTLDVFNNFVLYSDLSIFNLQEFKESEKQMGYCYFPADSINLANIQNHLMYINKIPTYSSKSYGILMYMIPESSIKTVIDPAIGENSCVVMVDPDTKNILFHFSDKNNPELINSFQNILHSVSNLEEIRKLNINNKKYSSYVIESGKVPYLFIQLMPEDLLSSKINRIRMVYLISMIAIIIISGFVISILMRINYRPIKNLKNLLEENLMPSSKNISREKLNEIELLEYALLQYNKENVDLREFASSNKAAVKNYLIDCFLAGQASKIDNIMQTCSNIDLQFNKNYYCVIIVKTGNIQKITLSEAEQIVSSINIPDEFQTIVHRDIRLNNIVVILGCDTKDENQSKVLALKLIKSFIGKYQSDLRVGVGCFYNSMFQINYSHEEALKVLEYNNILSKSNIICFSDISKKGEKSIQYPFDLFESLENSIRKNDIFSIRDTINQLVYYMKDKNLSMYWAKNICFDTANTITKELLKKYSNSPLLNKPYIERIYGSDINTFEDIESIMEEISDDITNYLKVDQASYELKLLQQIIKYIQENYPNPEFTLQNLADSIQMSTPYISQYFKKNTDYTISEYVTRLRMEKAKDLLLKTEMTVQEIASSVGYYSVSSFIRKFREKEKITPGQYKNKFSS
jgi:two-component system response regulator YesN